MHAAEFEVRLAALDVLLRHRVRLRQRQRHHAHHVFPAGERRHLLALPGGGVAQHLLDAAGERGAMQLAVDRFRIVRRGCRHGDEQREYCDADLVHGPNPPLTGIL